MTTILHAAPTHDREIKTSTQQHKVLLRLRCIRVAYLVVHVATLH